MYGKEIKILFGFFKVTIRVFLYFFLIDSIRKASLKLFAKEEPDRIQGVFPEGLLRPAIFLI